MSKPTETLFEINADKKTISTLGIPLEADLTKIKILINDIDVNLTMVISSLKILKEY